MLELKFYNIWYIIYMSYNSKIKDDVKSMLEKIIASGGSGKRSRKGGMYEKDDDYLGGIRAGRKIKGRGTSPWISHVKKISKKKGISYAEALSDPMTSSSYKKMSKSTYKKKSTKKKMS